MHPMIPNPSDSNHPEARQESIHAAGKVLFLASFVLALSIKGEDFVAYLFLASVGGLSLGSVVYVIARSRSGSTSHARLEASFKPYLMGTLVWLPLIALLYFLQSL